MKNTNKARAGAATAAPPPPKGGEGDEKKERGWRIVLMHRKVGKLGNLGRTTGWIHREALVNSGRVTNMGGVTYKKVDEPGWLHIPLPKKGKEKNGGGRRERKSRIIDADNIAVCAIQDPKKNMEITASSVPDR